MIKEYTKPSCQGNESYDVYSRQQIIELFQFIHGKEKSKGIPQSDNNLISNWIGWFYLIFGDLLIDDILIELKKQAKINEYMIIRYVDDIVLSLLFFEDLNLDQLNSEIINLNSKIADVLYSKLGLTLNPNKTAICCTQDDNERKEFMKSLIKYSPSYEYCDQMEMLSIENDLSNRSRVKKKLVPESAKKVIEAIKFLNSKKSYEYIIGKKELPYHIHKNISLMIDEEVGKGVLSLITNKPEFSNQIKTLFSGFDFEWLRIERYIMLAICSNDFVIENFKCFYLSKPQPNIFDVDIIIYFLCQNKFSNNHMSLIEYIKENKIFSPIINKIISHTLGNNAEVIKSIGGLYDLTEQQINSISSYPKIIEQVNQRVFHERRQQYSVAINHLENELLAICRQFCNDSKLENEKDWSATTILKFLSLLETPHLLKFKIRNLFDRRNANNVSHPSSNEKNNKQLNSEEYWEYHRYAGECLKIIVPNSLS